MKSTFEDAKSKYAFSGTNQAEENEGVMREDKNKEENREFVLSFENMMNVVNDRSKSGMDLEFIQGSNIQINYWLKFAFLL